MRPELRRCAVYVLIALAGLPFVVQCVNDLRPPDRRPDLRVVGVADGVLALGAISILRWRLRADERGIARRRLLLWHLYPWDEFATGRVKEGTDPDSYTLAGRPPWNRRLMLRSGGTGSASARLR
jgi:hypothetical protein